MKTVLVAMTATQCIEQYELYIGRGLKPFTTGKTWIEKLLLYRALYDIELRTPVSFLVPALYYWWKYDLPPRVYFTDRQLKCH